MTLRGKSCAAKIVGAVLLLTQSAPAFAQNIDINGIIGGLIQGAIRAEQQRPPVGKKQPPGDRPPVLDQPEDVDRDDDPLHTRGRPSTALSNVAQLPTSYVVDGFTLGKQIDRKALPDRFSCEDSEQFGGLVWCRITGQVSNATGKSTASTSLLSDRDGRVVYANKFVSPAVFGPGEITQEVNRLTSKFRSHPNVMIMPAKAGLPNGMIVTWGDIKLDPLEAQAIRLLADGKSVTAGIMLDFLGNFRTSAQQGQPVYRLRGGPGFFWAASYDQTGRGNLRFGAANLSAFEQSTERQSAAPISAAPFDPSQLAITEQKGIGFVGGRDTIIQYSPGSPSQRILNDYVPEALGSDVERRDGTSQTAQGPVASDIERKAQANGADAAARFDLPVVQGAPMLFVESQHGPSLAESDRFSPSVPNDMKKNWTRAILALGWRLAPDEARKLPDRELLNYARIFSPSQLGEVDRGQRCDFQLTHPDCVFAVRDAAAAFRSKDLQRIIAAAPSLPLQVMLVMPVTPESWDAARGGFPLSSNVAFYKPAFPTVFGTEIDAPVPDFWPADEQTARAYVKQQPTRGTAEEQVRASIAKRKEQEHTREGQVEQYAPSDRAPAYLAMPLTIIGMRTYPGESGFDSTTGLPKNAEWRFEPGEVTLYSDRALTHKLHSFGLPRRLPSPLIGTPSAESAEPLGPVPLDEDSSLLLLLRTGREPDWAAAAQMRLSRENSFRHDLNYAQRDPWGVFFDRQRRLTDVKPNAAEIEAFKTWTLKRAAALPSDLVLQKDIWPAEGPRKLVFFDVHSDNSLQHQYWPFPGTSDTIRDYSESLKQMGIAPEQMLPIGIKVPGFNLLALSAVPQGANAYRLDLPNGVPAQPGGRGEAAALLKVRVVVDRIDAVLSNSGHASGILLRLQPTEAKLDSGDAVLASKAFPPQKWPGAPPPPAPIPKVPEPAHAQVPSPVARFAAGKYGPDVLGIRLGATMAEAEDIIRKHMVVAAVVETETLTGPASLTAPAMMRGKVFVGSDRPSPYFNEQIAIFEAVADAEGKVIAVSRTLYVPDGGWEPLRGQLIEKYGEAQPRLSSGELVTWTDGSPDNCKVDQVLSLRWAENPAFPGRMLEKVHPVLLPIVTEDKQAAKLAFCGPTLEARRNSPESMEDGKAMFRFETKLFDPGVLAWLAARYKKSAPTVHPESRVKL